MTVSRFRVWPFLGSQNKLAKFIAQAFAAGVGLSVIGGSAVAAADVNLAAKKPTFASTELRPAKDAVDGEMWSRWESTQGVSPSWLAVDLGEKKSLSSVVIDWEAGNPSHYEIQGSNDKSSWTTLAVETGGKFGDRRDTVAVQGEYRYVRIFAIERSEHNIWGYSIFELAVMGSDAGGTTPVGTPAPTVSPVATPTPVITPVVTPQPTVVPSPVPTMTPVATPLPTTTPDEPLPVDPTPPSADLGYTPLFPVGTGVEEQLQYTEADGTLVTMIGMRPTERHARERGEPWDAEDQGPGRYFTFPSFYFQNRTFGLEIRDGVPAGRQDIEVYLHVNNGTFRGTTFSLFRNVQDPTVRDFGWSLNYGFNNPNEGGQPICHAGSHDCMMMFDSNWRTDPHSRLQVGDKIELAPAPRLLTPVIDGGGERYYSFEQLYVVGKGLRPWYGIAPNLDSEPLVAGDMLGGQTTISYNYSEEPHRVFQQMANNIGIKNAQRFVEGRRLFHTSFEDGKHSEHPESNPVFTAHIGQLGDSFSEKRCISCHTLNGRSKAAVVGEPLYGYGVMTGAAAGKNQPDPTYGFTLFQQNKAGTDENAVRVDHYEYSQHAFDDGAQVELRKPIYSFGSEAPQRYSVRQAPQVIGMGLLESIDESAILAGIDANDSNGDGVIGKANWVTNPETGDVQLGRFGWKASKASIRHQVSQALVQDMSITSPVYPKRSCQKTLENCHDDSATTQVSEQELVRLSDYISLLGVPAKRSQRSGYPAGVRVPLEHDIDPSAINAGETLFAESGCTSCHAPSMKTGEKHPFAELRGQTIHPYSDLLLHDMGEGLADTLAQGEASASMWRTQPLWGLGSLKYVQGENGQPGEASYLHDGRARTLDEAILWHGGEATTARQNYQSLNATERARLKAFLNAL